MTSEGQTLNVLEKFFQVQRLPAPCPQALGLDNSGDAACTQGRQPELAYASPGPPADMAVRRKRKEGEKKKRENRTEHKKGEFELGHMEGADEGYQQGH